MSGSSVFCATCGAANPSDAVTCFACGHPPLVAVAQPPGGVGAAGVASTILPASQPLLKQRYRLLAQIGKGGFGAVYQAEDTELGNRKVAVKEMSQHDLTPEEVQEATQAFRNEALLLAGLTHPNLPRIYEQFSEGGHWYLVMDFIEGETLEERLSRTPGGRLPVSEVLRLGLQLCTVLDYLHTRQPPIIFRDLKPANIIVSPAGDISLIDFGIARHFKPGQTRDTVAFGSAGYAAPEQYGKAQTTAQADIYSLGATLHQVLSGNDPADSPFLFSPLGLAEPMGMEALILQMLETHPSKRPTSMAVIKEDLQHMADDLATQQKQQKLVAASVPAVPKSILPPLKPVVTHTPPSISNANPPLLLYRGHKDRINTVAWSPDGKVMVSGGNDRTIQIWESASGTNLRAVPALGWVLALAWSPDGEELAWVSEGKTVHILNADTGDFRECVVRRHGFFDGFIALAWSPDGSRLAAGGPGKTVEIWEAKTGGHLLTYTGHRRFLEESGVSAVAWSPDGIWIASASADATVQVWEAATGHLRCTYRGYQLWYRGGVAWCPDSTCLASAGEKATIRIWDAASGMERLLLSGHSGTVNTLAWSPDGKYLASGGSDRTVRVWEVAAAKEVMVFDRHAGEVNTVAWSPDGTRLASAGDDATVCLWHVGQDKVVP
jgi:WD40 repeat protein/tRNA A-37 threonylcarbamoyl transferase component Bud32